MGKAFDDITTGDKCWIANNTASSSQLGVNIGGGTTTCPTSARTVSTMGEKAALVIGAGSGTGGAIAKRFAREGFVACVVRRTAEKLPALVAEIERGDVPDAQRGCHEVEDCLVDWSDVRPSPRSRLETHSRLLLQRVRG